MPSSRHAKGHKDNIAPPSSRMLKPSQSNRFENNTPSVSLALEGTKRWQRQDKDPDSPQRKRMTDDCSLEHDMGVKYGCHKDDTSHFHKDPSVL